MVALDLCGSLVSVLVTATNDTGESGCVGSGRVIEYVYEASDECGNVAVCTQVVTVVDMTAPELVVPADVTVECGASTSPSATGEGSATDGCDPSVDVVFSDSESPGECPGGKVITRTWSATDAVSYTHLTLPTILLV